MNINDSVYFDGDTLVANKSSRVIYSGSLCEGEPEEIYMHYGYGLLWEKLSEIKLLKGLTGYEADITFTEFGDVYFCFRSSNGKWDNNKGQNFSAAIEKEELILAPIEPNYLPVPKLKKSYLIKKKIKVAFYRTISLIVKLFSGDILKKRHKNSL